MAKNRANVQRRDEVTSPLQKSVSVTGVILAGGKSRRMGQNKALLPLGEASLIEHVIRRMRRVTDDLLLITQAPAEYIHLGLPMHRDIIPDTGALGGIYTGLTYASDAAVLCVGCDSPFLQPKLLSYLISVLGEYDAVMPYTYGRNEDIGITNPSYHTAGRNEDIGITNPSYHTAGCNEDIGITNPSYHTAGRNEDIGITNPSYRTDQITLQTLCAVYAKRCLPVIEQMLHESELRVHALQERATILPLAPEIWKTYDSEGHSFFNVNTPEDFQKAQIMVEQRH